MKNEVARVAKAAGGVWRESWSSRDHGEQAAEGQSAMRWDARVGCAVKPPDERCAGERVRDWRGNEATHVGCSLVWQWVVMVVEVAVVVQQRRSESSAWESK